MSAEARPCQSLTCCVTLGKFLDLSELENSGTVKGAGLAAVDDGVGRPPQLPEVPAPPRARSAAPFLGQVHTVLYGPLAPCLRRSACWSQCAIEQRSCAEQLRVPRCLPEGSERLSLEQKPLLSQDNRIS